LASAIKLSEAEGEAATSEMRRGARLALAATTPAGIQDKSFQFWEDMPLVRTRSPGGPSLPVATITPFSHRIEQLQIQKLSEATMDDFKSSVLDLLRQFDPLIRGLDILSPGGIRPGLYIRHDRIGTAPLTAFGDGMRRALMYALTVPAVAKGVLLIDELEAAIHVSALGQVFSWLVGACIQHDVQLFATTHSLEALDAVLEAARSNLDQIAGYRLDEAESTAPVRRYGGDLLRRLRYERGLDVR
jgi:hypothetical protein